MNRRIPRLEDVKAVIGLEGLKKRNERLVVIYTPKESGDFRRLKGTLYLDNSGQPILRYHIRPIGVRDLQLSSGDIAGIPDSLMHYRYYRVIL